MRGLTSRTLHLALVAVLAVAGLARAADVVFRAFEDDPVDQPPPGFTFATMRQATPGVWAVRGGHAQSHLEHVADAGAASGLSLAVVGPAMRDVQVSAKLQLVDGERIGGIVWRYQAPTDFYAVVVDLQQPGVTLYRVVHGNRIRLDRFTALDLAHDLAHGLSVRQQGDDIRVQLDGIGIMQVHDRGLPNAGRAGVLSGGASRTWFDDVRIEDVGEARR